MRRGLPGDGAGRRRRGAPQGRHRRRHRHPAHRRGTRRHRKPGRKGCVLTGDCIRPATRRQSALPAGDGARRHGAKRPTSCASAARAASRISAWSPTAPTCWRACNCPTTNSRGSASKSTARLKAARPSKPGEQPDFVFYTGCNVLKTPHIALLALDIMDALGVTYKVMGGPTHCCGVIQSAHRRHRDVGPHGDQFARQARRRQDRRDLPGARAATCSSPRRRCRRIEKVRGARPFEMTPFMLFLATRFDRFAAAAEKARCRCKVALHKHPGVKGVVEAGDRAVAHGAGHRDRRARPAGGRADEQLPQRAAGVQTRAASAPNWKRRRRPASTRWSRSIIPTTANCARMSATGRSRSSIFSTSSARAWGCSHDDHFKRLKIMQDADADRRRLRGHDRRARASTRRRARDVVVKAMLPDQPLPLRGTPA